jgi:phage FluMu gp28-like protein
VLDEFALHNDQRLLYRIAKPVTTWGGQLILLSTHRGSGTVFNELIRSVKEGDNQMGWSLHSITLQAAVAAGLVEKINAKTGRTESREAYLARIRAECLDEEQWQQEYCCVPSDDSAAFITWEMITACESPRCLRDLEYLRTCPNPLYAGVDVGRKRDLTVIDVGERIGDVTWDRLRLELDRKTFEEQRERLREILRLPKLVRCCMDASGLGMQLAEEMCWEFRYKVEPITFTGPVKEQLAFPLRAAFEDRALRIDPDPKLRADLRGIKKETTSSGNIRFVGESQDSHCDRFWAKALRQHAAKKPTVTISSTLI